jgi:hypothetical protein
VDSSGKVLGKATGDLSSMAGSSVNEAGEIVNDSGEVVGKVSDDTKDALGGVQGKGQDALALVKGFKPDVGGGNISAGGIEINVQTTMEGMSLTIKIPGSFQQQ